MLLDSSVFSEGLQRKWMELVTFLPIAAGQFHFLIAQRIYDFLAAFLSLLTLPSGRAFPAATVSAKRDNFHAFSLNHCISVYFQNVEDALKIFKNPLAAPQYSLSHHAKIKRVRQCFKCL
jgi:protoporphyrinogen oxidase